MHQIIRKFRECHYKMTPQRRAIIETITQCTSLHPTAEQIHERVIERMPDVSLATVYNTLGKLVAIGQVYELNLGQNTRRYELARHEHIHAVCLGCGRIKDVVTDLETLKSLLHSDNGFRALRHDVAVYGYCKECVSEGKTPLLTQEA
jgi:Fe2+ or Zn2+ uptake regulation protein